MWSFYLLLTSALSLLLETNISLKLTTSVSFLSLRNVTNLNVALSPDHHGGMITLRMWSTLRIRGIALALMI